MAVRFVSEDISFDLKGKNTYKQWIRAVAAAEGGRKVGDIAYIFCSDEYLHKINTQYLNHDTLTDIITFDYTEESIIAGDIFISIERVKDNATTFFNVPFSDELLRVLIHGILHLLGYEDKQADKKAIMTEKENQYISLFKKEFASK